MIISRVFLSKESRFSINYFQQIIDKDRQLVAMPARTDGQTNKLIVLGFLISDYFPSLRCKADRPVTVAMSALPSQIGFPLSLSIENNNRVFINFTEFLQLFNFNSTSTIPPSTGKPCKISLVVVCFLAFFVYFLTIFFSDFSCILRPLTPKLKESRMPK